MAEEEYVPRRRKAKNRLIQLTELRPGVSYQMVATYGIGDDSYYVMQTEVDGEVKNQVWSSTV